MRFRLSKVPGEIRLKIIREKKIISEMIEPDSTSRSKAFKFYQDQQNKM